MKNKNSLTIFDVRRQKKKRFIIWTLVIVIIMTTCFGQAPLVSEADVDDKPENYTYFQCIVDEMTKDKDRKFTILEIVPEQINPYAINWTGSMKMSRIPRFGDGLEQSAAGTVRSWHRASTS